jgi:hypothetical protein
VASSILLSKPKEQLSVLKKFIEVRVRRVPRCRRVQLTDQLMHDRLIATARSGMPAAEQLQLDDGDPLWVEQLFDRASEEAVGGAYLTHLSFPLHGSATFLTPIWRLGSAGALQCTIPGHRGGHGAATELHPMPTRHQPATSTQVPLLRFVFQFKINQSITQLLNQF